MADRRPDPLEGVARHWDTFLDTPPEEVSLDDARVVLVPGTVRQHDLLPRRRQGRPRRDSHRVETARGLRRGARPGHLRGRDLHRSRDRPRRERAEGHDRRRRRGGDPPGRSRQAGRAARRRALDHGRRGHRAGGRAIPTSACSTSTLTPTCATSTWAQSGATPPSRGAWSTSARWSEVGVRSLSVEERSFIRDNEIPVVFWPPDNGGAENLAGR